MEPGDDDLYQIEPDDHYHTQVQTIKYGVRHNVEQRERGAHYSAGEHLHYDVRL